MTPELKERVREITENPNSGGRPPLTRSKNDYLIGSLLLWGLTERVMLHLGYKREDYGDEIRKELEPVVFAAMRCYAERRGGPQVRNLSTARGWSATIVGCRSSKLGRATFSAQAARRRVPTSPTLAATCPSSKNFLEA